VANLRKLVASALVGADLSNSNFHETALDRVMALAFSDALGASLWRLKYADDDGERPHTVGLLSGRNRRVCDEPRLRRHLCWVVVDEWLDDACSTCHGKRFMMATTLEAKRICPVCQGTGVKRHSDQSRMAKMHFDIRTYRRWETRFAALHQSISTADFKTWREVARQLGWIGEKALEFPRSGAMLRLASVRCEPAQSKINMPDYLVSSASG
jgi:hypothetical protein